GLWFGWLEPNPFSRISNDVIASPPPCCPGSRQARRSRRSATTDHPSWTKPPCHDRAPSPQRNREVQRASRRDWGGGHCAGRSIGQPVSGRQRNCPRKVPTLALRTSESPVVGGRRLIGAPGFEPEPRSYVGRDTPIYGARECPCFA